ncbi:MAG: hypothetical protein RMX96_18790 [Nostoc sp. ChiSLP02]|nr:hypothetical protein [Nostoc sp. DedSLP05]MDZ8099788.1 hypothetical protein [Nostoc sp. DedSLP01]MDZ8186884.1 hypothetical protein [Nostoc sp. ChiSLP02]
MLIAASLTKITELHLVILVVQLFDDLSNFSWAGKSRECPYLTNLLIIAIAPQNNQSGLRQLAQSSGVNRTDVLN